MLEVYKVGVTLEVGGNATSAVDKLISQMESLERITKDASASFGRLAGDIREIGTASRSIGTLTRAMERLSTSGAGKAVGDLDRMAAATRNITEASERLTTILRENAALSGQMARGMEAAAKVRAAAPGRAGGSGHGAGGISDHDVTMAGMGATMIGAPLIAGAGDAFERGMEVAHLRTQILADQRVSQAQADAMVQKAYEATTSAPGTRVAQNLEALIDLKNVTGSIDEAQAMLPRFAQLSAMLAVIDRKRGGSGDSSFAAAKAMELMGGMISEKTDAAGHTVREIDPTLLQNRLDMMARVSVATNGRVAPEDYLGFAKQARVAGMNLSDEFIYEKLPALMMGMGGPRAGTALMSMAQVFDGNKLTAKSMQALEDIGLASKKGISMRTNRTTGRDEEVVNTGAVYDLDLLRHDPASYIAAAERRMDAAGIHGTEAQINALMKAAQRTTIAGALADILKDQPVIAKEQQNILNTRPEIAGFFAQNDPAAKLQQMEAAFDKLVTTLGGSAMGDAVKLMDATTAGLNAMGDWAKAHPNLARVLTDTAAGLGAIAVAIGSLSMAVVTLGPALKVLGRVGSLFGAASAAGSGAAAGASGTAATAAGAAAGIGAGAAVAAGAIGAVTALGLLKATDPDATKKSQQQLDDLAKQRRSGPMEPQDGYGDGSGLLQKQSYSGNANVLRQPITVVLDGQKVGNFVLKVAAKELSAPSRGTTGFDIRATPSFSGGMVNA